MMSFPIRCTAGQRSRNAGGCEAKVFPPSIAGKADVIREGIEPDVGDKRRVERQLDAPVEPRFWPRDAKVAADFLRGIDQLRLAKGGRHQTGPVAQESHQPVAMLRQPKVIVLLLAELDLAPFRPELPIRSALLVREKLFLPDGVMPGTGVLVNLALVKKPLQDGPNTFPVKLVGGGGPGIILHSELPPESEKLPGDPGDILRRRDPLFLRRFLHLLPVLVHSGEEEHFFAPQAVISGHDIGQHLFVGVAEMRRAIGIINGGGEVEARGHAGTKLSEPVRMAQPLFAGASFLRILPPMPSTVDSPAAAPSFAAAFRFWLRLGFISFGGPAGQIAIMQRELVETRRWIGQDRFLHALNFCLLLPGPEAQQLAIYCGWLLHRTWGGIVAGVLFVLPSMFVLWGLSYVYAAFGEVAWVTAIFYGLKPAVVAIVVAALFRISRKTLQTAPAATIALLAFVALYFLHVPFPWVVGGAAAAGFLGGLAWPSAFRSPRDEAPPMELSEHHTTVSWARAARIVALCLLLWFAPVVAIVLFFGTDHFLFREAIFFSKAAVVTFGGAYAVLPYVAQQAVENFGWLAPGQMLDGLALAETTPGPLIMVLQFVGFMGGWNNPGNLPPLAAATLGALVTTWVTFVPCFLWIFLGAPHLERLRGNRRLRATLAGVSAAVAGVMLNLAVWFARHVFVPENTGLDWVALALGVLALIALVRWKLEVITLILAGGAAGFLLRYLAG